MRRSPRSRGRHASPGAPCWRRLSSRPCPLPAGSIDGIIGLGFYCKAGHPELLYARLCRSLGVAQFALITLLMIGAVEAVPYPVTVTLAVPFSVTPGAATGGVYVAVTVQVP